MKKYFYSIILLAVSIILTSFIIKPNAGVPLYPDLQSVIPLHLQLVNKQQQELLRFSNGVANTGVGELRLRAKFPTTNVNDPQLAIQEILDADRNVISEFTVSEFEYHPAHKHWHIDAVALYEIRKGSLTGPIVGTNSVKTTFCLIDWYKLNDNSNTKDRTYWECNASYQGISPGWVDQYHMELEGQDMNITGAAPGLYFLITTANPNNSFYESNYSNNTAWVSFNLSRESNGNAKIEVVGHSSCSGGLCGETAPNR